MLSDDEIMRRLRTIRHSPQALRNARQLPSINDLAKRAGLTRAALYAMLRAGSVGKSAARLAHALETCQGGYRARAGE